MRSGADPRTDRAAAAGAAPRRFRGDVQGLRAIAVGLVVLYHAGVPFLPGGYIGVDVFFVISGFLISTHLLESIRRDGRVGFAQFYARRARRILPASFVVAALTAIAVVLLWPPLSVPRVLRDALATVLYVPNIWLAIQNTDYLSDHSPSPYQHYWSLGVEEQFYLLWPLVLLGLVLLVRRRRRLLIVAVSVIAAVSLAAGVILTARQQPLAFFLLPTRAWELLAGALVGIAVLEGIPRMSRIAAAAGGWLGVGMILTGGFLFDASTPFPGTAALLPVAGTALVILCGSAPSRGGPTAALSVRPMQVLGLISYSLYLVHWPLLIVPQGAVGFDRPLPLWATLGLGVVVAVPLSWLLFRFVEDPLRSPRVLTSRRPRLTLLGVAAVTGVLSLGLVGAAAWAQGRGVGGGGPVAEAPATPQAPPGATEFVPANLTPSLEEVADDIPRLYPDGCHHDVPTVTVQDCVYGPPDATVRIALFGDSHAAQWFPALEVFQESDDRVSVAAYTKSSCPAVSVTVLDDAVPYAACDTWRAAVLAHLTADPPDLVVLSGYSGYELSGVGAEDRARAWGDGLSTTVRALQDAGSRVLVIGDTPRFAAAPPVCVSAHPRDVLSCAGDPAKALDAGIAAAERAATTDAGAAFADVTPYLCSDDACPVIVDDLLVYRDVNHLTATFARYLEPVLAPQLQALLPPR